MTDHAHAAAQEPLEAVDPARPDRFADGSVHGLMTRMRRKAPVHYCRDSAFGPYWSIFRHGDIAEIELDTETYSSSHELGGVSLIEVPGGEALVTFVQMDPPLHTDKRKAVAPAFAPGEMARLSGDVRRRTSELLDRLPRGETFDWVKTVSVRLTTDMLAILFDFPWEDRDRLPEWSDWILSMDRIYNRQDERIRKIQEMAGYFLNLWQARAAAPPAPDLLSMMIHSNALGEMAPHEFVGNMTLLVTGGNDTTRNTMSGLIVALDQWPGEWEKIRGDEAVIPNAASEIIRWQSPANHMRRNVTRDTEFRGRRFRKGDKVVMWYVSANRDEEVFPEGDRFIADRANARRHLAFGHGIHRCVGARIAELQVQVLMSEMRARGMQVKVVGDVVREAHPFISSIQSVPVRIVAG